LSTSTLLYFFLFFTTRGLYLGVNKSLATGLGFLFILFFCNFPPIFWFLDIFLLLPVRPGLPALEMIPESPGSPDHAPPGGANGSSGLLPEGVGYHPLSPHLLPDPPAATVQETARVLGSSGTRAKPRDFGRQAVIQLPRHGSADDADSHKLQVTETADREPRALDFFIVPMMLFHELIGSPDSYWYDI
jgi:hypothetical protein